MDEYKTRLIAWREEEIDDDEENVSPIPEF